jgi:hypothetical protein
MAQVPGLVNQVDPIALAVESGRTFKPTEKVAAKQHKSTPCAFTDLLNNQPGTPFPLPARK